MKAPELSHDAGTQQTRVRVTPEVDRRGGFTAGLGLGRAVTDGVAASVRAGAGGLSQVFSQVFTRMGTALGQAGFRAGSVAMRSMAASARATAAGAALVVPQVAKLAAGLLSLAAHASQAAGVLLVIPAAAIGTAGAVATLALAFKGFGGALSAAASGDMAKFNQQLRGMPPAMRATVSELRGLGGWLSRVRKEVQSNFWGQLEGQFAAIGKNLAGPVENGLKQISTALGATARQITSAFTTPAAATAFEAVLGATARGIKAMGPGLNSLTAGFIALAGAVAPVWQQILADVGAAFGRFGDWLQKISSGDQAFKWADTAWSTLKKLGDIALSAGKSVANVVNAIFGQDQKTGAKTGLESVADAFAKIEKWTGSKEGQQTIGEFYQALKNLGQAALPVASAMLRMAAAGAKLFSVLGKGGDAIGKVFRLFRDLALFVTQPYAALQNFKTVLADLGDLGAGKLLSNVKEKLSQVWDTVTGLFSGRGFGGGAAMIDLGSLFNLGGLGGVKDKIAGALSGLGGVASKSVDFAVNVVGKPALDAAVTAWRAVTGFVSKTVSWFINVVGKPALDAARWAWAAVTGFVSKTVSWFINVVGRGALNAAMGAWRAVTGFGSKAISWTIRTIGVPLLDRARGIWNVVRGFANKALSWTIKTVGVTLLERARNVWNAVKGFADKVLNFRINVSGLNLLDRLPGRADGGIVRRPEVSWIGEAGPEVVIPLSRGKRGRAMQLAADSGLTELIAREQGRGRGRTRATSRSGGRATDSQRVINYSNTFHVDTAASDPNLIASKISDKLSDQIYAARI